MIKGKWILGTEDISEHIKLRQRILVDEMGMKSYIATPTDNYAMHMLLKYDGVNIACSRIYFDGDVFLIDAICVDKKYRGMGVGDLLARVSIVKAAEFASTLYIHCTADVSDFFTQYGFSITKKRDRIDGKDAVWLSAKREDIKLKGECGDCRDCHGCKYGE